MRKGTLYLIMSSSIAHHYAFRGSLIAWLPHHKLLDYLTTCIEEDISLSLFSDKTLCMEINLITSSNSFRFSKGFSEHLKSTSRFFKLCISHFN